MAEISKEMLKSLAAANGVDLPDARLDAVLKQYADLKLQFPLATGNGLRQTYAVESTPKLVVLDASRRNPYERRFRSYSHGLALINAPNNALIMSSNTPGRVADDMKGEHSVLVTELLNELDAQVSAEGVFNKTRVAVSRVSKGEQMPSVSSSLLEDVRFGSSENWDSSAPLAPLWISTENGPRLAQE